VTNTILIVEDHDAMRDSLRCWLGASFPHYRIVEATSGEEGAAVARAELPCLVVMDIGLPGMSGIEATRQIKAALPETEVVILTIHEEAAYRSDALAAGASAFVPKRSLQAELQPTIASLLSARGQENGRRAHKTDAR
jgi:DNA-binding NarL/FixJ family response regulator